MLLLAKKSSINKPQQSFKAQGAKWQAKMGNWHTKKNLDGHMKGKIVSQNILGLPKQILMALHVIFLLYALKASHLI